MDPCDIELSFVVVTRNRAAALNRCLGSVVHQQLDRVSAELVVVDDNSTDDTAAVVERYAVHPELHVRRVANSGAGQNAGRNTGFATSQGGLVVFIDDDETLPDNFARTLVELSRDAPTAAAYGGPYLKERGPKARLCKRCEITAKIVPTDGSGHCEYLLGGNMAIRRDAFERVGPFDPTLSGYGNETEWFARARQLGLRLRYEPRLSVNHDQSYLTLQGLIRKGWRQGRGDRAYVQYGVAPLHPSALKAARFAAHGVLKACANGWFQCAREVGRLTTRLS